VFETAKSVLLVLSALFPIVDPLGGAPIFLALTRDNTGPERRALSWRIAINSFFLLMGSYLVGSHVLAFFGISIPVVQVGGGLLVTATGWAMLNRPYDDDDERQKTPQQMKSKDPLAHAFYPLTLPLTVGPGSISVAITLGANNPHPHGFNLLAILAALIGSVLIAVSIFLCYGFADKLAHTLGKKGMTVFMQLSSFLLLCIGVQIFWNGASALLASVLATAHESIR
jgi:multiple antibiotic resistance protein